MNNVTNHTTTAAVPDERLRILIVEDNRAIASALRIVLQHEGYDTRWCEDESVYNVIHDWKPSLILMDLKMPRLDGYYATNAIKTDPETKGIPVIVVTAENISRERLAEIHANDLLTKPFPVPRLLERVAFWINHPNDLPAVHGLSGPSAGGTPTGASGTGGTSGGAHATSGAGRHAHGGFGQPGFAGSRA
jgi:CheY-like chemotaxis protein